MRPNVSTNKTNRKSRKLLQNDAPNRFKKGIHKKFYERTDYNSSEKNAFIQWLE